MTMTTTTTTPTFNDTDHQRRLRTATQRLVIELGYLEHCLTPDRQNLHLRAAASGLDIAIDCLNEHLSDQLNT